MEVVRQITDLDDHDEGDEYDDKRGVVEVEVGGGQAYLKVLLVFETKNFDVKHEKIIKKT